MQSRNYTSRGLLRGYRPRVEALEPRLCLSVTVTTVAINGGNELKIVGDAAADTVNITDQGNGQVAVTDSGGGALGSADNVKLIKVDMGDGQDVVNYTLAAPLTNSEAINIKLGSGAGDTANLDLSQGVNGANLYVGVQGTSGDDTIAASIGNVSAGAHVGVYFNGRDGNDNLSLTATGNIDADSSLRTALFGAKGEDSINTSFTGQILGRLSVASDGGRDNDTLVTEITADAGSTGRLKAFSHGGPGTDNVTLNVTDNSGAGSASTLAKLHAVIFDPRAIDTLVHTDNVKVLGHGHGHAHA
ncbi:MAG: hypothetical protein HYX69_15800 [Planctomycetia bacterium]|nr:hypothetical protein [Planctomycetia bacterium]